MGFFESLVDQYMGRTPPYFDRVAARLRDGQSALHIRRGLEDDYGLTRMQAGKAVQSVERAIKAWRVSLGTGVGLVLLAVLFVSPFSVVFWVMIVPGVAQTVAGMRGLHAYQQATDPDADAETTVATATGHDE